MGNNGQKDLKKWKKEKLNIKPCDKESASASKIRR